MSRLAGAGVLALVVSATTAAAAAPVRHARVLATSREPAITDGRYVVIQPQPSLLVRIDTDTGRRVRAEIPAACSRPFIISYRLGIAIVDCVDGPGFDSWLVRFDGAPAQLVSTPARVPDTSPYRVGRYWLAGGGSCGDGHLEPSACQFVYVNRRTGALRYSPASTVLDIDSPGLGPYRLCHRVDRYERAWRSFVAFGFPVTGIEDCSVPERRRRAMTLRCRRGCDGILLDAGWVSWVNLDKSTVYARELRGRRTVAWRLPDPRDRAPGTAIATTHTRWALFASIIVGNIESLRARIYYVPLPRGRRPVIRDAM